MIGGGNLYDNFRFFDVSQKFANIISFFLGGWGGVVKKCRFNKLSTNFVTGKKRFLVKYWHAFFEACYLIISNQNKIF